VSVPVSLSVLPSACGDSNRASGASLVACECSRLRKFLFACTVAWGAAMAEARAGRCYFHFSARVITDDVWCLCARPRCALQYPVQLRATASLVTTMSGTDRGARTLLRDDSERYGKPDLGATSWMKVTKSMEGYDNRFTVTLRDSLSKTQVSKEAPEHFKIPEVRGTPSVVLCCTVEIVVGGPRRGVRRASCVSAH
jgi:hypothetical protein